MVAGSSTATKGQEDAMDVASDLDQIVTSVFKRAANDATNIELAWRLRFRVED